MIRPWRLAGRLAALLLAALPTTPLAAQEASGISAAELDLMREARAASKNPTFTIVQPVFARTISVSLPREFLPAFRRNTVGYSITEYIPEGQTLANWTRMITVTGTLGAGAARVEDADLADLTFNKPGCPGRLYRDLGPVTAPGSIKRRNLVIGCGALRPNEYSEAATGAAERGAIAFLRDDETVWTVQYAERQIGKTAKPPFDPATAPALLDKLAILACAPQDTSRECKEAIAIAAMSRTPR